MTSEKKDKKLINRKLRKVSKKRLKKDEYIEPLKEEIMDRWQMTKDRP